MHTIILYKITTTTNTEKTFGTLTIPATGLIVYGNWKLLSDHIHEIYPAYLNNELNGICVDNTTLLPATKMMEQISSILDAGNLYDFKSYKDQILWNIQFFPLLIALFRAEAIETGLASVGTNAFQLSSKLSSISLLLQSGMLKEAGEMLKITANDGFLTPDRLNRYSSLCFSADAIDNFN